MIDFTFTQATYNHHKFQNHLPVKRHPTPNERKSQDMPIPVRGRKIRLKSATTRFESQKPDKDG
jgi:hypothetical protein